MTWKREFYPFDWPRIRVKVLNRDQHRCCECKIKNFSVGQRQDGGSFLLSAEAGSYAEAKKFQAELGARYGIELMIIVLQVSHSCQDSRCEDEAHLRSLCQLHHTRLDKHLHRTNAKRTRSKKKWAWDADEINFI